MNIGLDVDDTIMDTINHLAPYVAEYFNVSVEYLEQNKITYLNLPKEWQSQREDFYKKYFDDVVSNAPIKPFARECLQKIKELGHSIIIITARKERFYKDVYKMTVDQLNKNNVPYDKVVCSVDKAKACLDEKIDLLIDDTLANCNAVREVGVAALVFNSKCNAQVDTDLPRVNDWQEVYQFIKQNS